MKSMAVLLTSEHASPLARKVALANFGLFCLTVAAFILGSLI